MKGQEYPKSEGVVDTLDRVAKPSGRTSGASLGEQLVILLLSSSLQY
jgi:hypothetical protein